jgi:hypothetical protein
MASSAHIASSSSSSTTAKQILGDDEFVVRVKMQRQVQDPGGDTPTTKPFHVLVLASDFHVAESILFDFIKRNTTSTTTFTAESMIVDKKVEAVLVEPGHVHDTCFACVFVTQEPANTRGKRGGSGTADAKPPTKEVHHSIIIRAANLMTAALLLQQFARDEHNNTATDATVSHQLKKMKTAALVPEPRQRLKTIHESM